MRKSVKIAIKYGREIEFKRNHLTDINRVYRCAAESKSAQLKRPTK
ncbi:hypothetical protein [Pseudoalteromonas phage XCL1123]|nr:hypothetical protein [Pseudoalteromonas phage XCL1123]